MSWNIPANRLDADQRAFLLSSNTGNRWISGLPGTGKSVLLVHSLYQEMRRNASLQVCIVLYTHSLISQFKAALAEVRSQVQVVTYYQFKRSNSSYDVILIDEVQDLPFEVLAEAGTRCRRLYVAGDQGQSIYEDCVSTDQTKQVLNVDAHNLTTIHRLTGRLIDVIRALFPEKRIDGARKSKLKMVDILQARANTVSEEIDYVWSCARKVARIDEPAAILLPSHADVEAFVNGVRSIEGLPPWSKTYTRYRKPDYDELNGQLMTARIPLMYVGSSFGDLATAANTARVIVTTYHSSKGLDFEHVFLPFLADTTSIWRRDPQLERTLLFVAMTRTRLNLTISHTGAAHPLIANIPATLVTKIELPVPTLKQSGGTGTTPDFVF